MSYLLNENKCLCYTNNCTIGKKNIMHKQKFTIKAHRASFTLRITGLTIVGLLVKSPVSYTDKKCVWNKLVKMQYFIYAWCIAKQIKLCINFVLIGLVLLQVELLQPSTIQCPTPFDTFTFHHIYHTICFKPGGIL